MTVRGWQFAGGSLLALVAAWGGHRVYTGRELPPQSSNVGITVPVGAASAPPAATDDLPPVPVAIPDHLPDVELVDRAGKPASLGAWQGKSLVINFWATWCAPCRHEIPFLKTLDEEWRRRDVQVVGIAVDRREAVAAYADKMKISYPLLIGEEEALDAARAFGVTEPAFPFTVFTDGQGDVVALFMGELHAPAATLILTQVEALNRHDVVLEQARHAIAEGLRALQPGKSG